MAWLVASATYPIHESCVQRASARALRTERSIAKMAEKSYRVEGAQLRKTGAPLTQEDLTLTVQHASARFRFTLLRQLPCA